MTQVNLYGINIGDDLSGQTMYFNGHGVVPRMGTTDPNEQLFRTYTIYFSPRNVGDYENPNPHYLQLFHNAPGAGDSFTIWYVKGEVEQYIYKDSWVGQSITFEANTIVNSIEISAKSSYEGLANTPEGFQKYFTDARSPWTPLEITCEVPVRISAKKFFYDTKIGDDVSNMTLHFNSSGHVTQIFDRMIYADSGAQLQYDNTYYIVYFDDPLSENPSYLSVNIQFGPAIGDYTISITYVDKQGNLSAPYRCQKNGYNWTFNWYRDSITFLEGSIVQDIQIRVRGPFDDTLNNTLEGWKWLMEGNYTQGYYSSSVYGWKPSLCSLTKELVSTSRPRILSGKILDAEYCSLTYVISSEIAYRDPTLDRKKQTKVITKKYKRGTYIKLEDPAALDPSLIGYQFDGWTYKGSDIVELILDDDVIVETTMKWTRTNLLRGTLNMSDSSVGFWNNTTSSTFPPSTSTFLPAAGIDIYRYAESSRRYGYVQQDGYVELYLRDLNLSPGPATVFFAFPRITPLVGSRFILSFFVRMGDGGSTNISVGNLLMWVDGVPRRGTYLIPADGQRHLIEILYEYPLYTSGIYQAPHLSFGPGNVVWSSLFKFEDVTGLPRDQQRATEWNKHINDPA